MDVENEDNKDSEKEKTVTLENKIEFLENENKKIRDEFNVQRAKMRELFLQKEKEFKNEKSQLLGDMEKIRDELNDARSQLLIAGIKLESDLEVEKRKAQEEIASLQQLVHETVEESSSSRTRYDLEMGTLQTIIQHLQDENKELKTSGHHGQQLSPHHTSSHESTSLAPSVVFNAVTKSLVRKLGADTFSTQENLEESMRKAQEDADMLRSLVVPLEEEIKALKDKLRSTDEQLQKCRVHCSYGNESGTSAQPYKQTNEGTSEVSANNDVETILNISGENSTETDHPSPKPVCDMCTNYEAQLVSEQQRTSGLEARLLATEKAMERHKEELLKEIAFRKDMEEKWSERKEEHKQQVQVLNERTLRAEEVVQQLERFFHETYGKITDQLASVTKERERVQQYLTHLEFENNKLVGKYSVHSQTLQSQTINLPDNVEELQEKLLGLQEELIIITIGKEEAQEQCNKLEENTALLQCALDKSEQTENELKDNLKLITNRNDILEKEIKQIEEKLRHVEITNQTQKESILELEKTKHELVSRVSSLQQELNTTETVQKDFVRLSQSLQVQLEKIRDSDMQVRWQHEEDASECPTCRSAFVAARKKLHCMHCGQIFCTPCLNRTVPSGPKQRAARVCDVCYTLLVKSSAPYFSTDPPYSPD